MTDQSDAGNGALSTDDAVGLLIAGGEQDEAEGVEPDAEPTAEPEAEPAADEPSGEGGEEEREPDEPEAEAGPAVEPPPFWKPEHKEVFAKLPAEAQEAIKAYDQQREATVRGSMLQAAEARKSFDAQAAELAKLAPQVAAVADEAQAMFERPVEGLTDSQGNAIKPMPWSQIDFDAWHKQDPLAASVAWTRFQSETATLARIKAASQVSQKQAQDQAFGAYIADQTQALQVLNPDLASDPGKRAAIGKHLIERGYTPDVLRGIGALDLDVAYDAMRWRELQARAKTAPRAGAQPPRTAQAQSRTVRPSAAVPAVPSQKRAATEAANRFAQTGNIDDAVAALNARGSG